MCQVQKIVLRLLQLLAQNAQRNFACVTGQPESEQDGGDLAGAVVSCNTTSANSHFESYKEKIHANLDCAFLDFHRTASGVLIFSVYPHLGNRLQPRKTPYGPFRWTKNPCSHLEQTTDDSSLPSTD